jgi:hypothetical protein
VIGGSNPEGLYPSISNEFRAVLKAVNFDERKEGLARRGKITLYSFRRYVKTVTEDYAAHSMSEYLLGHKKSPYYTKKEPERREIYAKSCERHLTYLDYSVIDKKLEEEKGEIQAMKAQMEEFRQTSNKMLSALATELQKKGAGKEDIISAIATALDATARPSTPEEIAEAKRAKDWESQST